MRKDTQNIFKRIWLKIRGILSLSDHIDIAEATDFIRNNIDFKGPNIFILAFAIIVASVGLNINSIPVIIGAMLISPLMGPIFGIGYGLGTNDTKFIKLSLKNLLIMVTISILASCIYFLISPLRLENPTELLARTNPTIYDVIIALFGGFAGITEICRKGKGTVISGVAIATALMPPLCTAGFGLAHGEFSYFIGALYLFFINSVFITIATFIMVKYLKFPAATFSDPKKRKRVKLWIGISIVIIITPSILSAIAMIRENNFSQTAKAFVNENKNLTNSYIYDYTIHNSKRPYGVDISVAGEQLSDGEIELLYRSAESFGLKREQVKINQNVTSGQDNSLTDKVAIQSIFERNDLEIEKREELIRNMETELRKYKNREYLFDQVAKEMQAQYPEIQSLSISTGYSYVIGTDEKKEEIFIYVKAEEPIPEDKIENMRKWLTVRLGFNDISIKQ